MFALPSFVPEPLRESLGRRGAAVLLALAIELLLALLLLFLAPAVPPKEKTPVPRVFGIDAPGEETAERAPQKARDRRSAGGEPRPAPPRPVETPPPDPSEVPPLPANFIVLTRRQYRAADIAGISPNARSVAPGSAPGTASGDRGDSALAAGRAPNGEPLYAAEWHVRPTRAQLSTYISDRARQVGWGLIACRTVANYRVEDCQELGESPRGSGLARSVRQAAWQFRVRPPRVGGRELVGSWVSIRIDYTLTER